MLLPRALSPALCLILVASWCHAQDSFLTETWLSQSGEANDGDLEPPLGNALERLGPLSLAASGSEEATLGPTLAAYNQALIQPPSTMEVPDADFAPSGFQAAADASRFQGQFASNSRRYSIGTDLYSPPEFEGGLIVFGEDVAMKIGGYVKADFIYDFNPIDTKDFFDTTSIPVGAPARTNTRFHARQTRMSFDTRWAPDGYPVRIFVEGDFFGNNSNFRLRQAYGEVGSLLVGQTWTTFTDVAAAPATLDFEGSVSNVNRRQAMVRWTQPVLHEDLKLALAAENPQFDIVPPSDLTGDSRTPSPDLVARLRWSKDWGQFQVAYLYRLGGFQPTGERVITGSAWGVNFTGTVLLTDTSKFYHQIVFGDGIGSYHSLPDAAPETATSDKVLRFTGWMVGYTLDWTDQLNSNFTYAENALDNALLQSPDDVRGNTYLAANLIWEPIDRVNVGVEYLYGTRENVDREKGDAHRLQSAFIFYLP